jgi:hypothetical protein
MSGFWLGFRVLIFCSFQNKLEAKNTACMCYTLLGVISVHEIQFETQIYTKRQRSHHPVMLNGDCYLLE